MSKNTKQLSPDAPASQQGIHINCDMGESYGRYTLIDDATLMPHIDACNIACGYHAGDPVVIDRTIRQAKEAGLEIGAHPSYPDRQGFGRRTMDISGSELMPLIKYQICALMGMAKTHGVDITHVKVHGALYNRAAAHLQTAIAVARAVKSISKELTLYAPYLSEQYKVAEELGLKVKCEAFVDRKYNADRSLVSRSIEGSVIGAPDVARAQVLSIHRDKVVTSMDDQQVAIKADTFCIHGDNPAALAILEHLSNAQ